MSIPFLDERAALEGLRLRCIDELAKGNRRKATDKEYAEVFLRLHQGDIVMGMLGTKDMRVYPLFRCLEKWLDLRTGFAVTQPNVIASLVIDILNKEEEDARETN